LAGWAGACHGLRTRLSLHHAATTHVHMRSSVVPTTFYRLPHGTFTTDTLLPFRRVRSQQFTTGAFALWTALPPPLHTATAYVVHLKGVYTAHNSHTHVEHFLLQTHVCYGLQRTAMRGTNAPPHTAHGVPQHARWNCATLHTAYTTVREHCRFAPRPSLTRGFSTALSSPPFCLGNGHYAVLLRHGAHTALPRCHPKDITRTFTRCHTRGEKFGFSLYAHAGYRCCRTHLPPSRGLFASHQFVPLIST